MTMPRAYRVALLIVLATENAAAEPPQVGVIAGLGVRYSWGPGAYLIPYHPVEPDPHAAVVAAITLPISRHLALGAHLGASKVIYRDTAKDCYNLYSIDLAITLQYTGGRFTIGPWLGRHVSRFNSMDITDCVDRSAYSPRWTDDFASYGVIGAVNVLARGADHLAVFADVQTGAGSGRLRNSPFDSFNYSAVTVGLAYRR